MSNSQAGAHDASEFRHARGYWIRRGRDIVLFPEPSLAHEGELDETSSAIPSRQTLIDPRLDFYAQEALHRMFKGDPSARNAAQGLFTAVKAGQLAGIYILNQQVPALRARKLNRSWWELIPNGEDAILLLDPQDPVAGPPVIAFRDQIKSDRARLDAAIRRAHVTFDLMKTGKLSRCQPTRGTTAELSSAEAPLPNIIPAIFCVRRPQAARAPFAPVSSAGPTTTPSACAGIRQPCEILDGFGFDSSVVTPDHQRQLTRIASCIIASRSTTNPIESVLIVGHTDQTGDETYNLGLGERRANAVVEQLIKRLNDQRPGFADPLRRPDVGNVSFVSLTAGEEEPISVDPARNRRVTVCLPLKPTPVPPPPPERRATLQEVATRCQAVLDTQPFPAEQKKRLRCVLTGVLDSSVDDHFIIDDDITRFLAGGVFRRMSPQEFARVLLRNRVRPQLLKPFFAGPKVRDDEVRANLDSLDRSILGGINRIERQMDRNSELNLNNPVLRQMHEFISVQQRNRKSIYFCYGTGQR